MEGVVDSDREALKLEPVLAEAMLPDVEALDGGTIARLQAGTYWLATVGRSGGPHLAPCLPSGRRHPAFRGQRYDARGQGPHCGCPLCVGVGGQGLDLVTKGEAVKVRDEPVLRLVADAYARRYGWEVTVREGAFHDTEGAPTVGPPPYDVYRLIPTTAFGFSTEGVPRPTRWRF